MHDFQRLAIWQRSMALSVTICGVIARSRRQRHRALLSQLERSIMSVPANIAEGAGQATDRQFANFLAHAIASLNESLSHLTLVAGLNVFPNENLSAWRQEMMELRRMMVAFRNRFVAGEEV